MDLLEIFRGRVVDLSKNSMIVETTGDCGKIDAFIAALEPYGIKEVVRTGKMGLVRGERRKN
jgi:acetolactate synthase-1/3 small subunit